MKRIAKTNRIVMSALALAVWASSADAVIVLTTTGDPVVEDFDNYRGLGFSATPSAGQLDSTTYRAIGFSVGDGTFGGEYTTGDFARGVSDGGVNTGGSYAFQVATDDYALGVQPTAADFTPGSLTIAGINQTGGVIQSLLLSADGMFLNDQDRSSRWIFERSVDDINYVPFFSLESLEARDALGWKTRNVFGLIPLGAGIADGGSFFIRIRGDDLAGSGSRDEFALNNLSITGITAIPEPSSLALLCGVVGTAVLGNRRKRDQRNQNQRNR